MQIPRRNFTNSNDYRYGFNVARIPLAFANASYPRELGNYNNIIKSVGYKIYNSKSDYYQYSKKRDKNYVQSAK